MAMPWNTLGKYQNLEKREVSRAISPLFLNLPHLGHFSRWFSLFSTTAVDPCYFLLRKILPQSLYSTVTYLKPVSTIAQASWTLCATRAMKLSSHSLKSFSHSCMLKTMCETPTCNISFIRAHCSAFMVVAWRR